MVSHCVGGGENERNRQKKEKNPGWEGCCTSSLRVPNSAASLHFSHVSCYYYYCMFLFTKCVFWSSLCHPEDRAFSLLVHTHNNPEKLFILKSIYACFLVGS